MQARREEQTAMTARTHTREDMCAHLYYSAPTTAATPVAQGQIEGSCRPRYCSPRKPTITRMATKGHPDDTGSNMSMARPAQGSRGPRARAARSRCETGAGRAARSPACVRIQTRPRCKRHLSRRPHSDRSVQWRHVGMRSTRTLHTTI